MKFLGQTHTVGESDIFHETNQPYSDELKKKSINGKTTAAGYFAFAQTPINPVEYSGLFKITVTSPVNAAIAHVLYVRVEGHANSVPIFQIDTKTNNSSAATTGLYYLRGVYPKVVNNGYQSYIEFYVYNATERDIKIELLEATNLELLSSVVPSPYNGTYQTVTTLAVLYNGIVTNGSIYGTLSGTASQSYYLYNANFTAGESLVANDLIFLGTDKKWYKCSTASKVIPIGTMIARCAGTYALNNTVGAYTQGYFNIISTMTGTRNLAKDLFIRGQISGTDFTTDGTVTTEIEPGYSYIRVGSYVNTDYLHYDGNNRIYTTDANGKLIALDGIEFFSPTKISQLVNDSGFITANHSHKDISIYDTRNVDHKGFDYKGLSIHLKLNTTDGLNDGGTYHGVIHITQWDDSSGGRAHQLGFTDNGNIWFRDWNGTAWSAWVKLAKTTDIPTKMSQLENDIGAGGGIKITTNATAPSSPSPGDFWYKIT